MELQNKKILVTGGHGFLGRYVCFQLRRLGCHENLIAPWHYEYDLTYPTDINNMLDAVKPDVIIHLAAVVGGIGANRAKPATFFYANAMMGIELIHQACMRGIEKFVGVGTVCSYPKHTPVPFKEESLWEGYPEETNAPYGLAKKMLLVLSQAYRQQCNFNAIYLIPANLYGPCDNFNPDSSHVIPALIAKCHAAMERGEQVITCWGTGTATREFLYVEDAAMGIVQAAERYNGTEPVNLGTGCEITISTLAQKIADFMGYKGTIKWDPTYPDGQPRRCLDTSRAEQAFGFKATTSLDAGLAQTIAWYQKEMVFKHMSDIAHQSVRKYTNNH